MNSKIQSKVREGNFFLKLAPLEHVTTVLKAHLPNKTNRCLRVIMSLFKAREWWEVNLNENEMFDSQSLLIVSLEIDSFQSILLGNHKGILRLFSLSSELPGGEALIYKPSHLLLEVQLGSPILQINEGALVSGSHNIYLGVLHPRLFSVYTIKKKESKETSIGDQMEIELVYQHVLRHSAHSFVLGNFGNVKGRSFVCIQSLDGLLSFYEQESFAFQLYLPNFILPYTFSYIENIDSFLFLNGLLVFDCYSYEVLASGGSSNEKKILKNWEFNLGEGILDINVVKKDTLIIVVLGERNLFGLNETGKMIFMKRLESTPISFCTYLTEENGNLMIIMALENGLVNLFEEINLKWSMKIDQVPVSIKRIFLKNLPGGIVLLTENGLLQIVYIGTHPSIYLIPPLVQPDIDIQKAQTELKQLQQKITDNDIVDNLAADLVDFELKINKTVEVQNDDKSCNVMVEVNCQTLISKIQVLLLVEPPLAVTKQSATIFNCSDKVLIENFVYINGSGVVSSLVLKAIVTYIANGDIARSIHKKKTLPLELVVSETTPIRETLHKITISINKPVCGVNHLFQEFTSDETSTHAIGFKFRSGDVVTILAAKSSQKYRLQADSLVYISLLLEVLLERLKIYFKKESDHFIMTYSGSLPFDDFSDTILRHQELIRKKKTLEDALSKQTSQYLMIQKKILLNLKDVTPRSSNLYNLLKDTSDVIRCSLDELNDTENELIFSRSCLRSMNRLMITLLELFTIKNENLNVLKTVFNADVQDVDDQSWLAVQEATISFLLRTVLVKSVKDQQKPNAILLEPVADASKLIKHFSSVIDRVTKGSCLLERNDSETNKEPILTLQAPYESDDTFFDDVIPTTSKLLTTTSPSGEKLKSHAETLSEAGGLAIVEEGDEEREEIFLKSGEVAEESPKIQRESQSERETLLKRQESDNIEIDDEIWDVNVEEMRI